MTARKTIEEQNTTKSTGGRLDLARKKLNSALFNMNNLPKLSPLPKKKAKSFKYKYQIEISFRFFRKKEERSPQKPQI